MNVESDASNLYRASVMLLSDRPTKPVDAVFFHNRSYGDDTNLLSLAARFITKGRARFVVVTNNEGERFGSDIPYEANPGKTYYINSLRERGVPQEAIVVPDQMAFHTRQENDAFIKVSRERRWASGAILTQPHQLLRTLLGAVQAMNQLDYFMKIYAIAPNTTPWYEVVKGSQGAEEKEREQHIEDELRRITLYQSTEELSTLDELFNYLRQREQLKISRDLLSPHFPTQASL